MATSGTAYRQVMKELEKGTYCPVYYLMGDEPFFIDSIADYIREHALPEEARDFTEPCERASDCRTLPMWTKLNSLINGFFDSVTVADLMK